MSRIDQMPEYQANLGRHTHDLSHSFGFTCTTAHLLPVYHDLLQPGEKVRLSFNYNLRTQPLQSAAMEEIDTHVEYFFVPMPLLYEPFGSTYFNLNDNFSSNFPTDGQNLGSNFPVLDFSAAMEDLWDSREVQPIRQDGVSVGESSGQMAYRLLDHLGYNNNINELRFNPNVFPYPILAYHAIYQYYYRLDSREKFDNSLFNWDRYYNTNLVTVVPAYFFRLYYRPRNNDYFSDVKISPIVDVLNLNIKNSLEQANQWLTRNSNSNSIILQSGSVGDSSITPFTSSGGNPSSLIQTQFGFHQIGISSSVANGLDIGTANIRAMFATEKLWSVTGRAKKHYDDQVLAHLGYQVPHDPKHEVSVFGHDRSVIHIGEVISTASTDDAPLGEIAGKGYGRDNSQVHEFTAPCHGVVMIIFSVTPRYRYGGTYLKVNALTSRQDLPIPEYDHLGMQPLFRYEGDIVANSSERNDIMGWQYRYEQYKRRFNRVTKAFQSNGSLESWMLDFSAFRIPQANVPNQDQFANYLYMPTDLNDIMLVRYNPTWSAAYDEDNSAIYDNDPFVVDSYISSKKISWMSDYSLPRLDA